MRHAHHDERHPSLVHKRLSMEAETNDLYCCLSMNSFAIGRRPTQRLVYAGKDHVRGGSIHVTTPAADRRRDSMNRLHQSHLKMDMPIIEVATAHCMAERERIKLKAPNA